jgi:hypothetical protein
MMASTAMISKAPKIGEEKTPQRSRPGIARRRSDDTFSFHQSDWNDSEVDGPSASDRDGQSSQIFLVTPRKNAIQPITRKVTETEQEWFSEWEEMDEDSPQVRKRASGKEAKAKKKKDSKESSRKWELVLEKEDGSSSCSNDGEGQGSFPQHQRRKVLVKSRSRSNLDVRATASKTPPRIKQFKSEEGSMDASHRGKTSLRASRLTKVGDQQTTSYRPTKQSSTHVDDMDESSRGKKKSAPEQSLKERNKKDSNDDDLDISRRRSKEKSLSGAKIALETSSRATSTQGSDKEAYQNLKTKDAVKGDSKKSMSRATSANDDDIDTSRRGNSSRKSGGKDIISRRTTRRATANDDDDDDEVEVIGENLPQKEKKESRLTALRRASMAAASAIDEEGARRGRGLDADDYTVSSSRRSVSVSRRASVTGDGLRGREADRREDDGPRARSRSRRSVSRGRAPEKPQPREKSMLGECQDSDHDDEEDDVERLFRKAQADERKFMLDKSRVGPVRALERAGGDDEDDEPSSPMSPRRRKKSGYLPTNLNDTSSVQVPTSTAPGAGRRKGDKMPTPRKQSLDDLLFNFSGPAPSYVGSSASVGYSLTEPHIRFASSASVPGEMLAKKSSSPSDWTKNVDNLLDARRRSHMTDSPHSYKGQLHNNDLAHGAVVSASYANKMRQLQNTRAYSIGGAPGAGSISRPSSVLGKTSNLVVPMINASPETKRKIHPLGIRRPTMF